MSTSFLIIFFVCLFVGFSLIGYGDSKKKNATFYTNGAWFTGLIVVILGFSLFFFGEAESYSDKEAIKIFWWLLLCAWLIGLWMMSLESYPQKKLKGKGNA